MIHIDHSKCVEHCKFSPASQPLGLSAIDQFLVTMTDELLRTTRQYAKWKAIRQKDPLRTNRIANLVLQRHAWVAGKAPANVVGRNRFDQITDQLKKEGIYLYKNHEFNKPIFPENHVIESAKESSAKTAAKTLEPNLSSGTLAFRRRLANKDCFEFLAGILEENGISYYGKDGVANALIDKGHRQGKNLSAYLTGEGVTQLLCQEPKTIHVPQGTNNSLEEIWSKLEPYLKEGAILSYSSKGFGHTGIASYSNGRWVYINSSGSASDRRTYQVLEEDLQHEISGWLKRAKRNEAFLDITLGTVSRNMAARFQKLHQMTHYVDGPEINLLA